MKRTIGEAEASDLDLFSAELARSDDVNDEDDGSEGDAAHTEPKRVKAQRAGVEVGDRKRRQLGGNDQVRQYADGFAISAFFGPLPGKNPFWREEPGSQLSARYDLAHRLNRRREPPPLRLLGDTNLTEEVRQPSLALRRFAQRVFFRNLKISDEDMGNNTMASKLRSDGQLHGQWAQGIVNWQKDYQNKLLEFVRVGMMACIVSLGGNRRWAESTKEDRAGVYEAYWSQDGKYMTALFFRPVIEGIDLDGIFARKDGKRRKWQRYVKTVFMWVCEDTYKLRLEGNNPGKVSKVMASNFRQMAWSSEMMELDLGDVDSVPVTVGAPPAQNKRAKLQPMVGERRVLADV